MKFPQLQQIFDEAADRYGFASERPHGKVVVANRSAHGWTLFTRDFSMCVDADLHHATLICRLPQPLASGSVAPHKGSK